MAARSRRLNINANKPATCLLPATTPIRRPGGAAGQPGCPLAYLGRMGENTFRYRSAGQAGSYWRRRFMVLTAGLAVLAVISWALSSLLSVSPAPPGHRDSGSGGAPVPGHPAAGAGGAQRAGGQHAAAQDGRGAGQQHGHGGQAAASGSAATASPRPKPSGKASYPGIRPNFCARGDIVISLSSGLPSFGPRQSPAFSVSVVSTQSAECSFNVGPSFLALIIKEGPVRVWSSADCVRGPGGLITALKRGVPTVLPITWDRRTSSPGCSGRVTEVPAGVYTAYAAEGAIVSDPVTFRVS